MHARLRGRDALIMTKPQLHLVGAHFASHARNAKIVPAPRRTRLPMTIVANMRLVACRVRFRMGLGATLAELGPLLGSFWMLLGVSWAPFARFLNTLGRIWALMDASGLNFRRSSVPLGWVLESSSGSFRHGFWPCLWRVATDPI